MGRPFHLSARDATARGQDLTHLTRKSRAGPKRLGAAGRGSNDWRRPSTDRDRPAVTLNATPHEQARPHQMGEAKAHRCFSTSKISSSITSRGTNHSEG